MENVGNVGGPNPTTPIASNAIPDPVGSFELSNKEPGDLVSDAVKGQQDPAGVNRALEKLTDPQLKQWATGYKQGFWGPGGLPQEQKTALFNNLAKNASGYQLARLAQALEDKEAGNELGDSIAKAARPKPSSPSSRRWRLE